MFAIATSSTYTQDDTIDVTKDPDLGFDFRVSVDFKENCSPPSCQKHHFVTQASYDCDYKGCTITFPLKYGMENDVIQFDPNKCTIDEALLNLEVQGQWGDTDEFPDGKPKLYLGYDETNYKNNIEIDGNSVQCQNNVDGNAVCISEYMSCLKNYDLLSVPNFTITPADK